jgi:hypothetical protein
MEPCGPLATRFADWTDSCLLISSFVVKCHVPQRLKREKCMNKWYQRSMSVGEEHAQRDIRWTWGLEVALLRG